MSRHGKPAQDSARLNVIVPKTMKERIEAAKKTVNALSISDVSRLCFELGLQKIERKFRKMA